MPRVLVVQHSAPETLGIIADVFREKGVSEEYVRPFQGQPVPADLKGMDGLVVLGGPMGVRDQEIHPFLRQELALIGQALQARKPVLGVCQGSQLLAAVLGARVSPGRKKEMGCHEVRLSDAVKSDPLWSGVERSFTAYHWHGDVFELPQLAVSLARSEATEHEAFRHGLNAYGLLFHLEVTENMIREMIRTFSDDLREQNIDGGWLMEKALGHLASMHRIARTVFGRWVDLLDRKGGSR